MKEAVIDIREKILTQTVDLGLTDPNTTLMHYNENEKKRWKMTHTHLASASKLRRLLGRTGVLGIYKLLN